MPERYVLVTTQHRGVFFGLLEAPLDEQARTIALQKCRNVIYWSGKRGFLGLASHGPEDGSRVGSEARRVLLHDITSVTDCSSDAVRRFKEFAV